MVVLNPTLSWSCSGDGGWTTFDMYFGTTDDPPLVVEWLGASSWSPGTLENDTLYYWKVRTRSSGCTNSTGPLWSFRTTDIVDTASIFRVDAAGNAFADRTLHAERLSAGAADIAEWVSTTQTVQAGDVLEHDPDSRVSYRLTTKPCSTLVAGVVSSDPGVSLGQDRVAASSMALLALAGIVPVKVTCEGGPISPGDLLVTSSTPGHAMRWAGPEACPCSLVGKALEPMTEEHGVILVLMTAH